MSATASASNLNAKLAQTVVAASSWASALIAGDDDKWSVIDQSSPGVRRFSVAGLKGEVLVTQPVDPATGERLPRKAAAEAVALTMLRESANACTGVLPFEFVAEHGVLVVEIRKSFNLLSAGNARGGAYPTAAAHVGTWLARNEIYAVAASLGSSAAGTVSIGLLPAGCASVLGSTGKVSGLKALLVLQSGPQAASSSPDAPAPLIGASLAASLTSALLGSAGFDSAMAAHTVQAMQPECVSHGSLTSLSLSVAPPGARSRGDFMESYPTHGSADGTEAAAAAAEADLGSILGGVASSGGLISKLEPVELAAPKAATDVAAEVAAAAATQLAQAPASSAQSGAGSGSAGGSVDDGSASVVSGAPTARAAARGTDAGSLLGSLVVTAAAAAVTAVEAESSAASASGYGKHIAVERALAASRKQAEAAASCGALIAAYTGSLASLLGADVAAAAAVCACRCAAAEVLRQLSLPAPSMRVTAAQHVSMEIAALRAKEARITALTVAAAAASVLAVSGASAVRSALLAPACTVPQAATRAGAAVSGIVSHALMLTGQVRQSIVGAEDDPAALSAAVASSAWGFALATRPFSLVVIAKPPIAGAVKTRLAASLVAAGVAEAEAMVHAAAVAKASLLDTLESLAGPDSQCTRIVYVAGDDAGVSLVESIVAEHRASAGGGATSWSVCRHGSADATASAGAGGAAPGLSEVMQGAMRVAQKACLGPSVFIGADMPAVTMADVAACAAAAAAGSAMLLPAIDGGYVVAALPAGCSAAACFGDSVSWSTSHTFATQAAAIAADPAVCQVAPAPRGKLWCDVDDLATAKDVVSSLKEQGREACHLARAIAATAL